jgi:hypothetical protein
MIHTIICTFLATKKITELVSLFFLISFPRNLLTRLSFLVALNLSLVRIRPPVHSSFFPSPFSLLLTGYLFLFLLPLQR